MCEYWADFYLVHTTLEGVSPVPTWKDPGRSRHAKWHNRWPSAHHHFLSHNALGAQRTHWERNQQPSSTWPTERNLEASLFYQSLLVASRELKDKDYCVPGADTHCISWLIIHSAVLLPGKLMLLPFGVFCPQCSGCHMYGLFHGLPVYQMEQLFSCTPNLHCFPLKHSFSYILL